MKAQDESVMVNLAHARDLRILRRDGEPEAWSLVAAILPGPNDVVLFTGTREECQARVDGIIR